MKDLSKRVIKFFCHGIFWVFLLSVRWDGRTLFSYTHEVFVENSVVEALDGELADAWFRLSETARVTFSKAPLSDEKNL